MLINACWTIIEAKQWMWPQWVVHFSSSNIRYILDGHAELSHDNMKSIPTSSPAHPHKPANGGDYAEEKKKKKKKYNFSAAKLYQILVLSSLYLS